MKNRIASLFLVFALLMSLCVSVTARDNPITVQSGGAERFTDVPTDHWAYAYINKVVGTGLFNGKTPTTFEPSNAMTRSQFVLVMARMEGRSDLEGQVVATPPFPDVTTTRLAAGPIAWAAEQGFVLGFGDGTFKPDSPITRGQFAALIHRYITAKGYTNLNVVDPEPAQFTDAASVSTAFTADVEYARLHGLLTGYSDGTVRSGNPITRAAIAAILARFLDLVSESVDPATGAHYVPLLDYPRPNGGGDNGDSGNTGGTTSTDFKEINLVVDGQTHGANPTLSATRNGQPVSPDDLQQGDRVVITYKPDDGYVATVRVRDANKRIVSLNRIDANSSWFYMPAAQPVTVTVTYSRESSGGGGGGGGSSSSSGSSSATYRFTVAAAVDGGNGKAYATNAEPKDGDVVQTRTSYPISSGSSAGSRTGYAVFVPDAGFQFDSAAIAGTEQEATAVTLKRSSAANAETVTAYYVAVTRTTTTGNPTITVTGKFKTGGGGGGGEDEPVDPTTYNWTVNATNGGGAYLQLVNSVDEEGNPVPAPTADVTATTEARRLSLRNLDSATQSVYLAVTPQEGYNFIDALPEVSGDAAIEQVSATDTLRVYKISKTLARGANSTTVDVTMSFPEGTEPDHTYDVTIETKVFENGAVRALTDADTDVPRASVTSPATMNETVTITVPQTSGYGVGYKLRLIDGKGDVTVTPDRLVKEPSDLSASTLEYTFTMPDSEASVVVVYEKIPDEELVYTVNASIVGQGKFVLNIGGTNYPLPDERYGSNGSYTISYQIADTEIDADGNTVVKKDANGNAVMRNMRQSDYVKLYPDRTDWSLPMYVSGQPIASDGYKYEDKLAGTETYSLEKNNDGTYKPVPDKYYTLLPNTPKDVRVTFDDLKTFGYTLTVIGPGSVAGDFNGNDFSYAGNANIPQTYTDSIVGESGKVTVDEPTGFDAATYEFDPLQISGDTSDTSKTYGSAITINENGAVDLLVNIHKKERVAVPFTVIVGANGSTSVKAEGGALVQAANAEAALTALNGNTDFAAKTITSSATYYAFDDSIITITPTPNATYKVYAVYATDAAANLETVTEAQSNLSDVYSAAGFSFKLVKPSSAEVKFGKLSDTDPFSVLVQAPYSGAVNRATRNVTLTSQSSQISETAQILQVLYSLNNGQDDGDTLTDSATNIANGFYKTPNLVNQVLEYYLNTATNQNGETGETVLRDMLKESIEATLASNIQSIIDAQKDALTSDRSTVSDPLKAQLTSMKAEANQNGVNVTGAAKSSIVSQILEANSDLRALFDAKTITESNFTVTVNVTPILLTEDEGSNAKDKSVQTQLETFIAEYLNALQITFTAPTPNVDVDALTSTKPVQIVVSATANFASRPTLVKPVNEKNVAGFVGYLDNLKIWANVELASVTVNIDNNTQSVSNLPRVSTLYAADNFGDAMQTKVRNALQAVDGQIDVKWTETLDKMIDRSGNMNVNMGQVLTQELMDQVVDKVLSDAIDKLVVKVDSIKRTNDQGKDDAPATRAAVMNLYHDYVVFNSGDASKLLTLKTKGNDEPVVGYVPADGQYAGNLVLTVDADTMFRDKPGDLDKTSYEKLIDLLVALRDGMSTDIRLKSEANGANQTAQSVFAALVHDQMGKSAPKVTKWGKEITSLTAQERKELANLVAGLMMSSLDTQMKDAWQAFEDSGYQSVEFKLKLDANKRGGTSAIVKSLNSQLGRANETNIELGFSVTQNIEET